VLIGGSIFILSEAIPRLINPEAVNVAGMFWLAILGVTVNGISVLRLRGGTSLNERVVTWHLLEDVLGWVAVLIVSIVMYFKPLPILDPILSILIMVVVLWNVIKRLNETMVIFLQAIPAGVDIDQIETEIAGLKEISSIHDTHIWSLDGEHHIASTHIVIPNDWDSNESVEIRRKVRQIFANSNIDHVTIEIEVDGDECGTNDW